MASRSVRAVTAMANGIGGDHGISCRYEHSMGRFRWNFYRGGKLIGNTVSPSNVIKTVEHHIEQVKGARQ